QNLTTQHSNGQGGNGVASYSRRNTSAVAGEVVSVSGGGIDYTGTEIAIASASSTQDARSAVVVAGGIGAGSSGAGITVTNTETAVSFLKGSNIIAEGKSETLATIKVNGQTYVVAEEVAIAVARSTQFGSSSAASVDSSVSPTGNGYAVTQVITTKASSR